MKPPRICPVASAHFAEERGTDLEDRRYMAVLFRNCVYVAAPRHMDAIKLAFAGMSDMQVRRVSDRIADGKEKMLFGTARGDGTDWHWDEEYQEARMRMYGFEERYK